MKAFPQRHHPSRDIIDDLKLAIGGTKFTRATQPRPAFAICLCPCKREEVFNTIEAYQRISDWRGPQPRAATLMVFGALIGTIEAGEVPQ